MELMSLPKEVLGEIVSRLSLTHRFRDWALTSHPCLALALEAPLLEFNLNRFSNFSQTRETVFKKAIEDLLKEKGLPSAAEALSYLEVAFSLWRAKLGPLSSKMRCLATVTSLTVSVITTLELRALLPLFPSIQSLTVNGLFNIIQVPSYTHATLELLDEGFNILAATPRLKTFSCVYHGANFIFDFSKLTSLRFLKGPSIHGERFSSAEAVAPAFSAATNSALALTSLSVNYALDITRFSNLTNLNLRVHFPETLSEFDSSVLPNLRDLRLTYHTGNRLPNFDRFPNLNSLDVSTYNDANFESGEFRVVNPISLQVAHHMKGMGVTLEPFKHFSRLRKLTIDGFAVKLAFPISSLEVLGKFETLTSLSIRRVCNIKQLGLALRNLKLLTSLSLYSLKSEKVEKTNYLIRSICIHSLETLYLGNAVFDLTSLQLLHSLAPTLSNLYLNIDILGGADNVDDSWFSLGLAPLSNLRCLSLSRPIKIVSNRNTDYATWVSGTTVMEYLKGQSKLEDLTLKEVTHDFPIEEFERLRLERGPSQLQALILLAEGGTEHRLEAKDSF